MDKIAYKLLKKINSSCEISETEIAKMLLFRKRSANKYLSYLQSKKFITYSDHPNGETPENGFRNGGAPSYYEITIEGRDYLAQRNRDTRNFWVPYIITTLLATGSLLISVSSNWDKITAFFRMIRSLP